MVFKDFCVLVLSMKVASAFEGFRLFLKVLSKVEKVLMTLILETSKHEWVNPLRLKQKGWTNIMLSVRKNHIQNTMKAKC